MRKGTTLKSNIEKIYGPGPKQYQQGWSEFYKLKFLLTPDVLIPRVESELLIDEVLNFLNKKSLSKFATVLDLGTGSGCLAISIAKNFPKSRLIGVDISPQALKVAKLNTIKQEVSDKLLLIEGDLLSWIYDSDKFRVDVIVANLPYVPTAHLLLIDPLVSEFEPKIALDGGRDGFEIYRRLFEQMKQKNLYPKLLIIEIDETQSEIALMEAKKYFPGGKTEIKKDLFKKDRILKVDF